VSKKSDGLTRQGVRDLSYLKSKSVGRKLDLPPEPEINACIHKQTITLSSGFTTCEDCGQSFRSRG